MRKLKLTRRTAAASKELTKLDFTQAKDFDSEDLFGKTRSYLMFSPKEEDIPTPWDAGFVVKGNNFTLEGSAASNGFGSATVTIPKQSANKFWDFEFDFEFDGGNAEEIAAYLDTVNVKYKLV